MWKFTRVDPQSACFIVLRPPLPRLPLSGAPYPCPTVTVAVGGLQVIDFYRSLVLTTAIVNAIETQTVHW